jgi:hypothetical protein
MAVPRRPVDLFAQALENQRLCFSLELSHFYKPGRSGSPMLSLATRRARAAMHEFSTFQGAAPTPTPPSFFQVRPSPKIANDSQQSFFIETQGAPLI